MNKLKYIFERWNKYNLNLYHIFLKIIGLTKDKTSRNLFRLFQFAFYAIIIIFTFNLLLIKYSDVGKFGDFFGGVLNPILTFLTFMGLLITIILQQKELSQSREEFRGQKEALENQEFDNKFFQMVNLLTQIKNNLEFNTRKGQKVFELLKVEIIRNCASEIISFNQKPLPVDSIDKFQNQFKKFNNKYDENFKYYFLNLYQILNYVDKNSSDNNILKEYSNIIRAQLSKNELILLFYNGIGMLSIGGDKYKRIIEKYALFEHLTYEDLTNSIYINDKTYYANRNLIYQLLIEYSASAYGKSTLKNKINEIAKKHKDNKTLDDE